ncbi:RDD family protein [Nanchangia anserum]|nr:RDD family protein [Nanchangia anserum]
MPERYERAPLPGHYGEASQWSVADNSASVQPAASRGMPQIGAPIDPVFGSAQSVPAYGYAGAMGRRTVPAMPGIPAHIVATMPVGLGRRILVHLLDAALIILASNIVQALLGDLVVSSVTTTDPAGEDFVRFLVAVGAAVVILVAIVVGICVTGWSPASALMKVRVMRFSRRGVPGWQQLGKTALEVVCMCFFFAIPYLVVVLATRDSLQRHAIDRLCDLYVVDVRAGRDPLNRRSAAAVLDLM